MNDIQTISDSLTETIKDSEFQTVTSEVADSILNGVLLDGTLKDLPIIGALVGLVKTGISVSDKIFAKKILSFLNELSGVSYQERKKIIDKIDKSKKYKTKIGETLIFIIDKANDSEKAQILGKLFKAFLKKEISYEEFLRSSACVGNVFLPDLLIFVDEHWQDFNAEEDVASLLTAGLVTIGQIEPKISDQGKEIENSELKYEITKIGKLIREVLTTKPVRRPTSLF